MILHVISSDEDIDLMVDEFIAAETRAWQDHIDATAGQLLDPLVVQRISTCDTAHHRNVHTTAQQACITHNKLLVSVLLFMQAKFVQ